jgi:hypothetical protein
LTKAEVNSYPVVTLSGRLVGLISRHNLTILLKKRAWVDLPPQELRILRNNQEEDTPKATIEDDFTEEVKEQHST